MLYLLDTDISSYIMRKKPLSVLTMLEKQVQAGNEIYISAITYAELVLGAKRSGNPTKHLHLIAALQERLHGIQPWDAAAAEQFADLQTALFNAGTPIGTNDTMIAAHALSLQAIMVTNNTRHFDKVPNLPLENWV